jgi:hypothetical protein
MLIQCTPPDEIVDALESGNVEVRRAQEATRLMVRYYVRPKQGTTEPISAEDLIADLAWRRNSFGTRPLSARGIRGTHQLQWP